MGAAHHDEETIELALTTLALAGDSPTKASAMLKEAGVRVSRRVIADWREKHAERYVAICDGRAREIERSVVTKARSLAVAYSDLETDLIAKIREQLENGTLKDASTAARNASVSRGISVDKMLAIDGRPTTIIEHRSADDILRAMAAKGYVTPCIDGEAVELAPPGVLPAGEDPAELG